MIVSKESGKDDSKLRERTALFDKMFGDTVGKTLEGYLSDDVGKVIRLSETFSVEECEIFSKFLTIAQQHEKYKFMRVQVVNEMIMRMALNRSHVDKVSEALKWASGFQFWSALSGLNPSNENAGLRKGFSRLFKRG